MVGIATEGQNFDGNGHYVRLQPGGGNQHLELGGTQRTPTTAACPQARWARARPGRDASRPLARRRLPHPAQAGPRRADRAVGRPRAPRATAAAASAAGGDAREARDQQEPQGVHRDHRAGARRGRRRRLHPHQAAADAARLGAGRRHGVLRVQGASSSTAQAVTPGQGQTVQIAGVDVGELTKVDLVDGRAIVSMKVDPDHPFYRDATAMPAAEDRPQRHGAAGRPGHDARPGEAPEGFTIPVDSTLPERPTSTSSCRRSTATRGRRCSCCSGARARRCADKAGELSNALRRFEPLGRDIVAAQPRCSSSARSNIKRSVHNFRLLAEALGRQGRRAGGLRRRQQRRLPLLRQPGPPRCARRCASCRRRCARRTPRWPRSSRWAASSGQTLGDLRPFARDLGPALRATRPFLRETEPIIRNQLRPFARDVAARGQAGARRRRTG